MLCFEVCRNNLIVLYEILERPKMLWRLIKLLRQTKIANFTAFDY